MKHLVELSNGACELQSDCNKCRYKPICDELYGTVGSRTLHITRYLSKQKIKQIIGNSDDVFTETIKTIDTIS